MIHNPQPFDSSQFELVIHNSQHITLLPRLTSFRKFEIRAINLLPCSQISSSDEPEKPSILRSVIAAYIDRPENPIRERNLPIAAHLSSG
jgi:hypothetical protein